MAVSAYMELACEGHVPAWNLIRRSTAIKHSPIRMETCGDYPGSD